MRSMPCTAPRSSSRLRAASLATAIAACVAALLTVVPSAPAAAATSSGDIPTRFRISSFNLLGWNHTSPSGSRKGWADGVTRTKWAAKIIRDNRLEIVGLQEFQWPQYQEWVRQFGKTYATWPGNTYGATPLQNSLAWDTRKWQVVRKRMIDIPYFRGKNMRMPYAQLRSKATGQLIWVFNTHNPANTNGPAQRWRDEGFRREMALVKQLERDYPGQPVMSLGDKNDREKYLCPVMLGSNLRPAGGGGLSGRTCVPPRRMKIDWIMGTSQVRFSGYHALDTALVRKTTDHKVIISDATIASPKVTKARIRQVVTINIQGLRSSDFTSSRNLIPHLRSLRASGASTLNARTLADGINPTANTFSMLTSRPLSTQLGGTGIGAARDNGTSLHRAAGNYVGSVHDVVHDNGKRTAQHTSSPLIDRQSVMSWGPDAGADDRVGRDQGRNKISHRTLTRMDRAAVVNVINDLRTRRTAYSFVTLTAADKIALRDGVRSARYQASVRAIDGYIGSLVRAIRSNPSLANSTAIIVTSNHGGVYRTKLSAKRLEAARIPFIVWGPSVRRGGDLYAMNPQFADPGSTIPGYTSRPAIRNANAGNLATKLLGLPTIPGSRMDTAQTMTVF